MVILGSVFVSYGGGAKNRLLLVYPYIRMWRKRWCINRLDRKRDWFAGKDGFADQTILDLYLVHLRLVSLCARTDDRDVEQVQISMALVGG